MIDIHTHLLPDIDDGCENFTDAITALKEAYTKGIDSIILTPHYIKGTKFVCNNKNKKEIFIKLQEKVLENNIKIELYLGNEVYFENNLYELINNGEVMTLNDSKYMLFELPMNNIVNNLKEVIFSLRSKGIIPVIAHPERYYYFQEEPSKLITLIKQGCLFQGNLGSLIGLYGPKAKKCIKILLMHDLIHFMASDVHHANSKNYILLDSAIKELFNIVGKKEAKTLIEENPLKVINNQNFTIKEPKEFKKIFHLF